MNKKERAKIIEEVIIMRNAKVRYPDIAEKLGISVSVARNIATQNWSKITFKEDDHYLPKDKSPDIQEIERQRKEEKDKERRENTKIIYQEAVIKILYDLGNSKMMIHRQLNLPISVIDKVIK